MYRPYWPILEPHLSSLPCFHFFMAGWNWEVEVIGWGCTASWSALLWVSHCSRVMHKCTLACLGADLLYLRSTMPVCRLHAARCSNLLGLQLCHFSAGTSRLATGLGIWGAMSLKLGCVTSTVSYWLIAHNRAKPDSRKGDYAGT